MMHANEILHVNAVSSRNIDYVCLK
jgi:hypothetical protein